MAKGFIFDLDGTVYLDDQLISGAKEAIDTLRKRGDRVVFLTNKSISTRYDYLTKLNNLGIEAHIDEIVNSNYITARYLMDHMTSADAALVIGEEALIEELTEANIRMTQNPDDATYIVFGWDRQFHYEKLNRAYQAWLKNKATILATNPDRTCPVYGGQVPDCAAMIGAMEGVTGQKIDLIMGKPSRLTAEFVIKDMLKMDPHECYMVGDRLETDILMGNENGMNSVLVLSGISTFDMVKSSAAKPSYIIESIKDIVHLENTSPVV